MNVGQILNFFKHFICKNPVMNFKISGFAVFTRSLYNLDFIKVTRTEVGKRRNFKFLMRNFFITASTYLPK